MDYLYELSNHLKTAGIATILEDCGKRYNNTYLLITHKGKASPFFIRAFNPDGLDVYDHNNRNNRIRLNYVDITKIEEILPAVGYHQTETGGAFVTKRIRRQWKRSLCEELYFINNWGNFTFLTFGEKETQTFKYTLNDLDADSPKTALSPMFAVSYDKGKIKLLYEEILVGYINYKTRKITPVIDHMKQEIQDLLNRTGISQQWKVTTTK